MTRSKFDIEGAYARALRAKGGELPTVREVARRIGAAVETSRYWLNKLGLAYKRKTPSEAAKISAESRRGQAEDRIRSCHEDLMARSGRPPTIEEMNLALGLVITSGHVSRAAKRLGLPLTRKRGRMEGRRKIEIIDEWERCSNERKQVELWVEAARLPRKNPEIQFGHRAVPSMTRILEITGGDEAGEGEGWAHRPGEGYAVADRIVLTCPVCGSRRLIAPRMHPYWLRNKAGKAVFVCREACTGRWTI